MSHPFHHSRSSARKFGGVPEDYQALHQWFDGTKSAWPDHRHRAILHNAYGIFLAEENWGLRERIRQLEIHMRLLLDFPSHSTPRESAKQQLLAPPPISIQRPSDNKQVPIRIICEQHVQEDLGRIPTIEEWLRDLPRQRWHGHTAKRLSEEEQNDPE